MHTRTSQTYILLFLVIVHGWLVAGCGGDATGAAGDAPLHQHVVCLKSADAQSESCEGLESTSLFNTWVKEAISRPRSTFSIWAVRDAPHRYHHVFTACIPDTWHSSVWKAKAAFIARAREGMSGTQSGLTVPAGCRPPAPQTPGVHQLAVSPTVAPFRGEVLGALVSPTVAPSLHYGIVCDRSDSTLGATCTPEALLRVFDRWVAEARAQPGASLSVEMVGPLQDALRSLYHVSVPDLAVGERVAFVLSARREFAHLLAGSKEQYASTIAEAISVTVRRLRERQGSYQLVVLSDLLQITSGVWNFGTVVPSPPTFMTWLKQTHLFVGLHDIPVLACGQHTGHYGAYSATHATRLHDLWQAVFQAMGAPTVQLFSSCDAGFAASKTSRRISS
jgi:hypothetical protein